MVTHGKSSLFADRIDMHIVAQCFRNFDGSVRLLIVFQNGGDCSANGNAAAVQCMDKFGLSLGASLEADIGAARLEIFEIGAGGNFHISAITGHPHFDIVSLGGRKAQVTCGKRDNAIG